MQRMKELGTLRPRRASEIKESRLGVGMEKLDRDAFEPERAYDLVAGMGVKWIRLQSGWQKTEKQKGVYDFAWLDSQVDNLLSRGLLPWLCLCYGNVTYDERGKTFFGSVGCVPNRNDEQKTAWKNYVRATAEHFAGRVTYYEVWNEPEGGWTWRPEPHAAEYAAFCIDTAAAAREGDENAKILIGSHYDDSLIFPSEEAALGALAAADGITYHGYHYNEDYSANRVRALKALCKFHGLEREIVQGESGSQSRLGVSGAFTGVRSTDGMQCKYILRHVVNDLGAGVKFASTFSAVDMAENLDAREGEPITTCGYFGMLEADFDPKTGKVIGEYRPKPSYRVMQNLAALFDGTVTEENLPVLFHPAESARVNGRDLPLKEVTSFGFRKGDAYALAYWAKTDILTTLDYEGTVTFDTAALPKQIRLIDPYEGKIYEIPEDTKVEIGADCVRFKNMPVKDYPLFVTFADFYKD